MRRRELLAGLVGVTGTGLLGVAARPTSTPTGPLAQHLLTSDPGPVVQPVEVQVLRDRLAATRATYHACRYHELAVTLPDVIATAKASLHETTGQQHDHIAALLADAYSLAADLCTRLHDNALAWVTAERARSAAHASGDVASIAEAARMASIAMRRFGHHDTATTLLTTTALDLGADSGDPAPELLATYGSLLCTASYTAAQSGNRSGALELITEAETAATRRGDARVPRSPFSPINVAIYQIGVHTALGDAGTALDYARQINLRSVPPPNARPDAAWTPPVHGTASAAPVTVSKPSRLPIGASLKNSADHPYARWSPRFWKRQDPRRQGCGEFAARCGAVA